MDVRITVEAAFDNGEKRTHLLEGISRPYQVTCPDGIGLGRVGVFLTLTDPTKPMITEAASAGSTKKPASPPSPASRSSP